MRERSASAVRQHTEHRPETARNTFIWPYRGDERAGPPPVKVVTSVARVGG